MAQIASDTNLNEVAQQPQTDANITRSTRSPRHESHVDANCPATLQKSYLKICKACGILGVFFVISWLYVKTRKSYDFGSTRTTTWLYFATATIAGLGYGHIQPTTDFQRVVLGVLQLIGQGLVRPPLQRIADMCGRKISEKWNSPRWKIGSALFMVILVLVAGMLTIKIAEKVKTSTAFYISVGITTGIGQTDLPLKTYFGEWFTIIFILFARCVFTQSMSFLCNTWF